MKKRIKSILSFALVIITLFSVMSPAFFKAEAANNYEKDIYYFLRYQMGMNEASACGVLANIEKESSFNPNLYGDSGTSYGICQWHKSRFDDLKSFCSKYGYDYKSITGQLYYLKYELEAFFPNTLKDIKSAENNEEGAYYAGYSFCYNFERPANKAVKSEQRGNLAKEYWKRYGILDGIKSQTLKKISDDNNATSAEDFTISWSAGEGEYNRNRLHIVPAFQNSHSYDWGREQIIDKGLSTLKHTVKKGTLPEGDYLVWVEPWSTTKKKAGPASKPVYLRVDDVLYSELESVVDGIEFDAAAEESIVVSGWAVNTGRYETDCYISVDGGESVIAEKVKRTDIASESKYEPFCTDSYVGFKAELPLSDISNGEHTISITLRSESAIESLCDGVFTVINSHDHVFGSYTSNNDATYIYDGTKTAKCKLCNSTDTVYDEGTKRILGVTSSFTAKAEDKSVTLSWKRVGDAAGYRVYIYNSGWKKIDETTALSYKVSDLKPSKSYRFAVKAYGVEEGETFWAKSYKQLTVTTTPSLVKSIKTTSKYDRVTLSWDKAAGASGYRVYVYNTSKKAWEIVHRNVTGTSATVKGLSAGKKYSFAVKPYYVKDGKTILAYSFTKVSAYTKLSTPEITASWSSAKGRVTLTWTKASGSPTGYQVWYSSSKNGTYKKYSNFTTRSHYLYDFKSGATRYFKVRAYKKVGSSYIYSNYTAPVAVKIK